jgi:LPXTG-motif cell wall-anchored protein
MYSIKCKMLKEVSILILKKSAAILSLIIILFSVQVQAHPGRTDRYGGHTVRTPGWGYPVGSYHYHNGGSDDSDNENYVDSDAEYNRGYKAGYKQGYKYGYNENYGEYTFYYTNDYYKDGYESGFDAGFDDGLEAKKLFREKQLKNDYNKGLQKGLSVSLPSKSKVPSYSKDSERQSSYEDGYNEGIQQLLKKDYNKGLEAGSKVKSPSTEKVKLYSNDSERQKQYETGYNDSIKKLLDNDHLAGYREGKEKHPDNPSNYSKDKMRKQSYEKGFLKGKQDFFINDYKENLSNYKDTAYNEGYESAYEGKPLLIPDIYTNHFILYLKKSGAFEGYTEEGLKSIKTAQSIDDSILSQAYIDGFNANTELESIATQGFTDGILFKANANLEKGAGTYDVQFNRGRFTAAGTLAGFGLASGGYIFYRKKKKNV